LYNLGISGASVGETTESLLKRIVDEATVREPDLILLTSGINDIRRFASKEAPSVTSPEAFEKNIHAMIEKARSVAKDVIFISTYPLKEKHDSSNNWFLPEDNKAYAEIVEKVCKKEQIPYIDVFSEWEKTGYDDLLGPDGVHANTAGYERIYEQVKASLLSLYKD
jgi:lysophospholipase L1-like esterase